MQTGELGIVCQTGGTAGGWYTGQTGGAVFMGGNFGLPSIGDLGIVVNGKFLQVDLTLLYIIINATTILTTFIHNMKDSMRSMIAIKKIEGDNPQPQTGQRVGQPTTDEAKQQPEIPFRIVAIAHDFVVSGTGMRAGEGGEIIGYKVTTIDYSKRKVIFNEDITVYLDF